MKIFSHFGIILLEIINFERKKHCFETFENNIA